MSKYIIELDDRIKLVTSVGVTENGVVYTTSDYVHNLEELNSDYINKNFGSLQDEAYQAGLNDAWEAARKINIEEADGGLSNDELKTMFGNSSNCKVMRDYTAQEAINRIKAYESKRNTQADIDCLMHETGMTIDEIVEKLKELRK